MTRLMRARTWRERREQLEGENRIGLEGVGPFPRFFQFLESNKISAFSEAQKIVTVPLMISEERYPDCSNHVLLYWTGECQDTSEFDHVFHHLDGNTYHKCDERCIKYKLPGLVK
ncbi:MAG: hypothetical protein A3J66_00850 [Candidatus Magasanikbacteria bacterium RIFCSPHIGHO2_02_FULL_47_14]|uniref:Uncharacterized protein n=1 Tax=Candidatus Magasanikbacteria bacterium RIFCSPHIGHO2_02_FULL_47_14 TaxID=1798680 RepID=A0A1F6M7Y0_9BACT|nr:MAG: hypothetical protein A3J66_00850 [Candidatus Magasanikbacteria bacterium RIFCSPHIGHO2_02_FULL_47_14]